jgi:hypothetical protein
LTDRRWHSSIFDIRSFRVVDCVTNHCLEVEKVRVRLAASKQAPKKFDVERSNLRKKSELEVRKQIKISKCLQLWRNLMIARA